MSWVMPRVCGGWFRVQAVFQNTVVKPRATSESTVAGSGVSSTVSPDSARRTVSSTSDVSTTSGARVAGRGA